ncbi:hypothetical protein [Planotetraspora sp. GP83]|uniref:hypothetical protein n=1 Tax=Planotetraspora sp. GP83 TaxID=3156264 RepID=UPI0035152815
MPAIITTVSPEDAEQVVAAIAAHFPHDPAYGPQLMEEDFDDRQWTIVWDEGPYCWALHASHRILAPAGVFLDAVREHTLGIYPA